MFKSVLFLICLIFIVVTTNPLQGFSSYPITQYQESYNHEQPILVQASDFNTYPHLHLVQNQLTPHQNIHTPYNDYMQRIYLENVLQNDINSALQVNCDQNCGQMQQYVNPAELNVPNVINNYIIVPVEHVPENIRIDQRKVNPSNDKKGDLKSENENSDSKKNKKCKKRKNKTNTEKRNKCSRGQETDISGCEKEGAVSKSNNQDIKPCKKSKSMNKAQRSDLLEKKATKQGKGAVDKKILTKDRNIKNNCNKNEKSSNSLINEKHKQENNKCAKKDKNTVHNCRKKNVDDVSLNSGQILEQDCTFNINEECAQNDNRCTRNYKEDYNRQYKQPYQVPSDHSNNMFPYLMFNHQLFDANGYFPYNFDYLYNLAQYPNENNQNNQSYTKPKSNRRTGRRKKQKKGSKNKKTDDQNITETKQSSSSKKTFKLSPTILADHKNTSIKATQIDEKPVIKTYQEVLDTKKEEIVAPLNNHNDSKETITNDCSTLSHDDSSTMYDDYYPEFHSHNIYTSTSKEEFEWTNFNDRLYYSSSDISESDRESGKLGSTDHIPLEQQSKKESNNDLRPITYNVNIEEENTDKEYINLKVTNKKQYEYDNPGTLNEEIQFKTPPALDFPDFETKMVNKEEYIPTYEVCYRPDKAINKNSKMSSYSSTKSIESHEKRNQIIDKNDIETAFVHSKVVKYGIPSSREEILSANDIKYSEEEVKTPSPRDGEPIVVIAKSLPYPIP